MDISAYQHMNIRMSTRGKRPLRNLTPNDKVRAIQRIHNGETKASVSRDIGVPESTLRGWCKNEQKLRFMCRQLSTAPDQMPLSVLENQPVEKRSKFDSHHIMPHKLMTGMNGFDEFPGYGRLPFSGTDFIDRSNNIDNNMSSNSILEKIALTEFMKKNNIPLLESDSRQPKVAGPLTATATTLSSSETPTSDSVDYSQLSLMQNHLSLLSLLNPSLMTISGLSICNTNTTGNCTNKGSDTKIKIPLRISNLVDEVGDHAAKSSNVVLSVKNWAKDPSKHTANEREMSGKCDQNSKPDNCSANDNNNNDIVKMLKQKTHLHTPIFDAGAFPGLLPKAPGIIDLPDAIAHMDSENSNGNANANGNTNTNNNNTALIEWCKVFNASLNFLALTAAAAALQAPPPHLPIANEDLDNYNANKTEQAAPLPDDNILYKQLTKSRRMRTPVQSDASNDSYANYESEPEDLSIRSTTSKISSLDNSRSQSPAKSTASSSSIHSNADA